MLAVGIIGLVLLGAIIWLLSSCRSLLVSIALRIIDQGGKLDAIDADLNRIEKIEHQLESLRRPKRLVV